MSMGMNEEHRVNKEKTCLGVERIYMA